VRSTSFSRSRVFLIEKKTFHAKAARGCKNADVVVNIVQVTLCAFIEA
jgi:hypothetical protein